MGRFDGTNSIAVYSDAIYVEPIVRVGYSFKKVVLEGVGSYMKPFYGDEYVTGKEPLPSAFPEGFTVGVSLGWKMPFFANPKL